MSRRGHAVPTGYCRIVAVGRRRDGGTKYWCLRHRADATARYGRPASQCRRAHISEPTPSQTTTIDTARYPGGIAIWGAVPPIYDTTTRPIDRGVHAHAREASSGKKIIDKTFRRVELVHEGKRYLIEELDAIYFMVSRVFGLPVKFLVCDKCAHPHLDKDWFSVHPHKIHLCAGCGHKFRDTERAVCNPVGALAGATGLTPPPCRRANREIELAQRDFGGGVRVWASNPAIVWSKDRPPESGIHIHAFKSKLDEYPIIDDTYSSVIMDGYKLDEAQVRTYMAQQAMPHIAERVMYLRCKCGTELFSEGEAAYTPTAEPRCGGCGQVVRSKSRLRKVIANPLLHTLVLLSHSAVREPRNHDIELLREAP